MADTLRPVKGLDVIRRGVYEIEHAGHAYAVEVDFLDFAEKVRLYRDGGWIDTKKSPARFEPTAGTVIEASMGLLGMKKLKLVDAHGERALQPAAGTAEARRAGFEHRYPTASRVIGVLSWAILIVALIVEIPQLIDFAADKFGFEFDSPLLLPGPVNTLIGVLAVIALIDRALRFKHNRWID
jgi:hypothetical protein